MSNKRKFLLSGKHIPHFELFQSLAFPLKLSSSVQISQNQARTQSLFMCFLRRLEARLRRARSHGKARRKIAIFPSYLPMRPSAPQPNLQ